MQHRWTLSLAAALAATTFAHAGDLRVSVSSPRANVAATQDVDITVLYQNTGRQTIYLNKWFAQAGELREPMFEVTRDGKAVDYVGAIVKRRAPTIADMIALAPGETLTRSFKVSEVYDMRESGQYSIRFNADAERVQAVTQRDRMGLLSVGTAAADSGEVLTSNSASLWVEGRSNKLVQAADHSRVQALLSGRVTASSVSYGSNCSTTQRSSISAGVTQASAYANESTSYLSGTPSGTPRYTTWFGKYSLTNWNTAKSHFVNIKGALDTKPLVFDCGCTETGTFAYVYPNQPYKIYLCGAFWSAPTKGTDSKGGTLIHELSHFTVIAGTQDNVYGQTGAKNLAKTNPTKALNNADNHEYFAENNPFQN
jgi:peptidyl-Lys metalloendopeptidase